MTSAERDATTRRYNDVFISYRRDTSSLLVEALYQRLTQAGIDAFYDIESIGAGEYEDFILDQIRTRPYFVLVLQLGSLDRSMEPGDWLTKEIECALDSGATLVPLYTEDFDFAAVPDLLPRALGHRVVRFQAMKLPIEYFRFVVQELIERLTPRQAVPPHRSDADQEALDRIRMTAHAKEPVTDQRLRARELLNRGKLKEERGDLSGAIADFDLAIGIDPDDALAQRSRSIAQLARERGESDAPVSNLAWGSGWRSPLTAVLEALGLATPKEVPLGCTIGRRAYRNAKLATQLVNANRRSRPLRASTCKFLQPLFPELDVTTIRYRSRCRLPSSAYAGRSSVYAVTFGHTIYWRDELDEDDPRDRVRLIHEIVHIDQMRRFGSEQSYACEYGKGYLAGGGDLPSYIQSPTAFHRNPLEAEAYSIESRFRDDTGLPVLDRLRSDFGSE